MFEGINMSPKELLLDYLERGKWDFAKNVLDQNPDLADFVSTFEEVREILMKQLLDHLSIGLFDHAIDFLKHFPLSLDEIQKVAIKAFSEALIDHNIYVANKISIDYKLPESIVLSETAQVAVSQMRVVFNKSVLSVMMRRLLPEPAQNES